MCDSLAGRLFHAGALVWAPGGEMVNRLECSPPERTLSCMPSPACLTSSGTQMWASSHALQCYTLTQDGADAAAGMLCSGLHIHIHNTDATDAYLCAPMQPPDVLPWELQHRRRCQGPGTFFFFLNVDVIRGNMYV